MNDKNIKIKWTKYFDHIWCISYIDKDRISIKTDNERR